LSATKGTVLVVGSGTMGAGIAQAAAAAGYRTLVNDSSSDQVERGIARVKSDLEKGVQLGKVPAEMRDATLGNLVPANDLERAAGEASFVIEAIFEDLAAKQKLFGTLVRRAPKDAVFATNTSALSITEIAASSGAPDRVVGMHFFNPVPRMALVEVIRGLETSDSTVAATLAMARAMGKEPVEINEFPGFAASRINAMIGNEAFFMLMEGVASARDIDKALKLGLNHPMGPFELGDLVGWDVRLKVLEYLHSALGEKFRPCPLLVKYVKAGRLGRKTGRGVYEYPSEKPG
jgi:3-hydroxybutyryl-CoA dehydrogenase